MIERKIAEHVKEVVLACVERLDRSIGYAFQGAPEQQAALYQSMAGRVMGLLFTELLIPIYAAFPELEPEDIKKAKIEEVKFIPLDVGLKLLEVSSTVASTLEILGKELAQATGDDAKALALSLKEPDDALQTIKDFLFRSCPGIEQA